MDKRGKHSKSSSPFEDNNFKADLRAFVKENGRVKGEVLTLKGVREWVGKKLGLEESEWFSTHTMMRWLHDLGFNVECDKKGLYVDGHERADVVESREKFMRDYKEVYSKECFQLDDNNDELPALPKASDQYVLVSQDEKCWHSNEIQKR